MAIEAQAGQHQTVEVARQIVGQIEAGGLGLGLGEKCVDPL